MSSRRLTFLQAAHNMILDLRQCHLTIDMFDFYLDNGYIEGKELDNFFHHLLEKVGPEVSTVPW